MSESIIGVLIGGGIAILTSLINQWSNNYSKRKSWLLERKAEALSNILKFAYLIKNKGSKVIYGKPNGKVLSQEDMRELFRESAELKYWMATSEIFVNDKNKEKLKNMRNKMDESLIPFHNFVSGKAEEGNEYQFDPNFGDELLDKIINIANEEL